MIRLDCGSNPRPFSRILKKLCAAAREHLPDQRRRLHQKGEVFKEECSSKRPWVEYKTENKLLGQFVPATVTMMPLSWLWRYQFDDSVSCCWRPGPTKRRLVTSSNFRSTSRVWCRSQPPPTHCILSRLGTVSQ